MRLVHKLFLVMTAVSVLSIVLLAATAHWQFSRSFQRYLEESRRLHLEDVAVRLGQHFRAHGDWRAFAASPRSWRLLLRAPAGPPAPPRSEADPGPRRPPGPGRRHRDVTLYDDTQQIVAGRLPFTAAAETLPITVDGTLRGWIGAPALPAPPAGRDRRFASRHLQILLVGAALASLLSLVAATFFARRIADPVARLGRAARQLAGGDLEARVSVEASNEIRQLGDDFNILARTLRQNESARRRYFADIAHELRTPLAILRGEIDAVSDGVRPNDRRFVESVDQELGRLERLIDDLYQLARADIGSLQYDFAPCNPAAIVRDAVVRFANRFEQRQLWCTEELDDTIRLSADPARLAQLLENLLENCCRYVAAPGRVRVLLGREHGRAVLRVEDSGPPPPAPELDSLFEPLQRGDPSRARSSGGAGLGLAICRAIVTAHGGDIRAEISPLSGLAVIIGLPLAAHA